MLPCCRYNVYLVYHHVLTLLISQWLKLSFLFAILFIDRYHAYAQLYKSEQKSVCIFTVFVGTQSFSHEPTKFGPIWSERQTVELL